MSQVSSEFSTGSHPEVPTDFVTDSGSAVPVANTLNIFGGTDISTSASGNTILINATGGIAGKYTADSGTAAPSAGNLNLLGTSNRLSTSASGSTVSFDISVNYVGQATITTLGTIATGVWHGTVVAGQYGGTGVANTGLTINLGSGATGKVLGSDSSGNATWQALSGLGVTSITGTANQVIASASTGAVTLSTPQDIGTASNLRFGSLTLNGAAAASALLTMISTTQGFLPPSMTTTQKNAISSPAAGLVVYDNVLLDVQFWNGSAWIGTTASGVTSISGTANRITASASTGAVTIDISAAYVGQTSITTLAGSINLTGNPTTTTQSSTDNSTRISTTAYVTTAIANAIAGVNPAIAVQAATTQASDTSGLTYFNGVSGIGATFTGTNNTALTIDGYTFTALGQRLLVKNDTQSPSGAFNGIYYVTQVQTAILPPILTRALDYDAPSDINNTGAIPVVNGTVNATTSWLLTSAVTTVGTDPLTYIQFSRSPTSILPLNLGGTNANLTASNGGIFYSTATAGAILAGTATANQMLLSGASTAPVWSTATHPATTTINQVLYSSANNVIAGITAANNGVMISGTSGIPSWLAAGITGQVLVATTGSPASWAALSGVGVTSITGTANQVIASASTGAVTLSTPQNIATASNVQFGTIGIGGTSPTTANAYIHGSLSSTSNIYGLYIDCPLGAPSGNIVTSHVYVSPSHANNAATISTAYGILIDSGSSAGTITTGYSLYVTAPSYGSISPYTAYFDPGVGIGAATLNTSTLQVFGSNAATYYNILSNGTLNQTDNGASNGNTIGIQCQTTLNPTLGAFTVYGIYSNFIFATPTATTISYASGMVIYNHINTNVGTITNAFGLWIASGTSATGTVSNHYGLFVNRPAGGTNRYTAYFDQIIGIGVTPQSNLAVYMAGTLTGTSGAVYALAINNDLGASSGTVSDVRHLSIYPVHSSNAGTITTAYGCFIDGGLTAGTITTGYGLYVVRPTFGTTKYTAYFDQFVGIGAINTSSIFAIGSSITGTSGNIFGLDMHVGLGASSGTLTNAIHAYIYPDAAGNAATISNMIGLYVDTGATAGTVNTGYGIFVGALAYGTTQYGLYVSKPTSGTSKYTAFFATCVGIGSIFSTYTNLTITSDSTTGQILRLDGTAGSIDGAGNLGAIVCAPILQPSSTCGVAVGLDVALTYSTSVANITTAYGVRIEAGSITGGGTIGTIYGLWVGNPTYGGTHICAYFGGACQFQDNVTGSHVPVLGGSNCPATTFGSVYTWIKEPSAAIAFIQV